MEQYRQAFKNIPTLSRFDIRYSEQDPKIEAFINAWPSIEAFQKQIDLKKEQEIDRSCLVDVLLNQHKKIGSSKELLDTIQLLKDPNCYTICTAHQLNLFTGPLYVIYKILTTIKLSRKLSDELGITVLPIYVMGSEDHDYEEINHAKIYNHKIHWQTDQEGAIGQFSTSGLEEAVKQLTEIIGEGEHTEELLHLLQESYLSFDNYGQAAQKFITSLFQKYNLIVLDMDDIRLKEIFADIMVAEATEQISHRVVQNTNSKISEAGLKTQVNPREINLFHFSKQGRNRLVYENGDFKINNQSKKYNSQELQKEIINNPNSWSPNVILRTLYQELILPNLCYIGGGGELAYWIQLKELFTHYQISFPILLRRESVLWLNKSVQKKLLKLNLSTSDIFLDSDQLIKQFIQSKSDINLSEEQIKLEQLISDIQTKAKIIDSSIASSSGAKMNTWLKDLKQINTKLHKLEKQKNEISINQIKKLKEQLFPNRSLQERVENFIPYFNKFGYSYFDMLLEYIDPFNNEFLVLSE